MKALVIDDCQQTVDLIEMCLTIRWPDTEILSAKAGSDAISLVEEEAPDIVLLEPDFDGIDGLGVLREIRGFSDVPLIVISATSEEIAQVRALEMGADDYVGKPFSPTELLARVQAVLRRSSSGCSNGYLVATRGLSIDVSSRRLAVNGQEVSLTPIEWDFLTYLARNEGRVIPHDKLALNVWGSDYVGDSAIRTCVHRLRLKLDDATQAPSVIRSHRGLGYSFKRPAP